MKKIVLSILVVMTATCTFGQLMYNDSSTNTSTAVYAGILAGPAKSMNDGSIKSFGALRAGGMVTWAPNKWSSIYGLGAVETDKSGATTPFSLFGLTVSPAKSVSLTVGKIGTPMTRLRPLPTTGAGQFEPWTKRQILGSALGGMIGINTKNGYSLNTGAFVRGNDVSTELSLGNAHVQLAGYYMTQSKVFGGALNCTYKWFSTTLVYNDKQNTGMLNVIQISKKYHTSLYSDIGFTPDSWNMIRGEWGVFTTTSMKYVSTLLGIGYAQETKSVKGYLFIHL